MSEPPDEPPPDGRPDGGWQPPGPPPPVPPYGQPQPNPYGGDTTSYYQPIDSGGMSSVVKVILGVVIGVFGGFFLWIAAAILFATSSGSGDDFLFFAAVAPLVVPAPLLIRPATRPWAVGLLMGTAISTIGMSGLCASLIGSSG